MSTEQRGFPDYRYEATIKLVIAAEGQDIAFQVNKAAAKAAKEVGGVEVAYASTCERPRPDERHGVSS